MRRSPEFSPAPEAREQPARLYHASPATEIEVFEPRNKTVRHPDEGPVVFATPDKASAMPHLFESKDNWTKHGRINGVHYILINSDRETFINNDKGGAVYELSGDGFYSDLSKGPAREWVNKSPVKPIAKEMMPSALDAMINHGVQVYFVDEATLNRFKEAKETDQKIDVLASLPSENQRRGVNIKEIK